MYDLTESLRELRRTIGIWDGRDVAPTWVVALRTVLGELPALADIASDHAALLAEDPERVQALADAIRHGLEVHPNGGTHG